MSMRGGPALVGGASPADLLARWDNENAPAGLFVGEYEGAVVGVLAVVARDAGGKRGQIECCYVDRDARGVGVGTALMEAAIAWCEASGYAEVDALALPGDRATKQRLEAAGFTARLLTLSRRLG
jgi:GNAT superfamily N-acetyltransferase